MPLPPSRPDPRAAFTLAELAIVLVIIGLLTGGIIVGKSLIAQTKVQAVMADFARFKQAVSQFRTQYYGYPGDITDAEDYWGTDTSGGGCVAGTTTPKKETCNGNGNGYIDIVSSETNRSWQQLADAGLIKGTFSGYSNTTNGYRETMPGVSAPSGPHANSVYSLYWGSTNADGVVGVGWGWQEYPGTYRHELLYGMHVANDYGYAALLTPAEAYAIDHKIDDSMPGTGNVFTHRIGAGCVSNESDAAVATATYALNYKPIACDIGYKIDMN